jgi:outer membrane protein assembly factor BamB
MSLVALLAALHVSAAAPSDGWPGWRGPAGSGVASGKPPVEFGETQNVRWKVALPGKGNSSPIVWGDKVFVTSAVGTGKKKEAAPSEAGAEREGGEGRGEGGERGGRGEGRGRGGFGRGGPIEEQDFVVLAFDRKSGKTLWEQKLATTMPHQGTHSDGTYAAPTPVTDGERLYVSFGSFGIYALDLAGKVLWQVDLGDMLISNEFGEGSSPVLVGSNVIVLWAHEGDSFLVALDAKSGKESWRTPLAQGTNWSTPLVVTVGGKQELVIGGPRIAAYDPATGKELWGQGEAAGRNGAIASPVALDELIVYAMGGRGGGEARALVAQAPSEKKAEADADESLLWSVRIDAPHVPSPLAYDGKIWFLKQDSGILSVLDPASGELVYGPERLDGVADVYASLVAAGGHLYVAGRDGTVEVLSTGETIATVAVNRLEDRFDSSPAIAGDELFLRGYENLYCIAQSGD